MNRRTPIKQYVVDAISSNLTDMGVFRSRRMAIQYGDLPACVVSIEPEKSELFSQSGQEVRKTAQLSIEVIAEDEDGCVDAVTDKITAKIESLLHRDESFGGLIDHCILKHTETVVIREGDLDLGLARMLYDVTYNATPTPSTDLTDYHGANLKLEVKS